VSDTANHVRSYFFFHVGTAVAEYRDLRFAVGTFDSWTQLRNVLHDVRLRGLALDSFTCLAFEHIFAGKTIVAPSKERVSVQSLTFPGNQQPVCCTSGPLADCLAERLRSGAPSLKDALGLWLVPRHATHFQKAVEGGKILLWIRLTDADDERRAYQSLLTHSSNSVGVHDLVALPPSKK
jgi:hypothetical protein